jgi:hypothetical protein
MSSMKMAVMKLGNTPRPAAWSPLLASFPSPALRRAHPTLSLILRRWLSSEWASVE